MCNIIGFLIIMLFTLFYVRVYILLACREHFYDRNLSRRREIWAHKTGLTASFFIEGSVPRHGSERLCICEGYWSCLFLSCVYWILGQFRPCFFFILSLKRTKLFTPQWEKGYKFVNKNVSSFFFMETATKLVNLIQFAWSTWFKLMIIPMKFMKICSVVAML